MACLTGELSCTPAGQAQADAITSCQELNCGLECYAICDTGLTTGDADCDTCLGDSCCDEFSACVDETACFDCITGGDQAACNASALDEAVVSCSVDHCSEACPGLFDGP